MPAFFYHLAFELHERIRLQEVDDCEPARTTSRELQSTDIFEGRLPVHHSSTWASYLAPRRNRSPSDRLLRTRSSSRKAPIATSSGNTSKRSVPSVEKGVRKDIEENTYSDWRTAEITIESVDMEPELSQRDSTEGHDSRRDLVADGLATRGKYVPSNPHSTDLGYGVVHLYRDTEAAGGLEDDETELHDRVHEEHGVEHAYVDRNCTTLCILAVPSYMTPSDLLGWVGEYTREDVSHFRLVRTSRSNRYMVLMKFRESSKAREWQREWNGKLFSVMEASTATSDEIQKANLTSLRVATLSLSSR